MSVYVYMCMMDVRASTHMTQPMQPKTHTHTIKEEKKKERKKEKRKKKRRKGLTVVFVVHAGIQADTQPRPSVLALVNHMAPL